MRCRRGTASPRWCSATASGSLPCTTPTTSAQLMEGVEILRHGAARGLVKPELAAEYSTPSMARDMDIAAQVPMRRCVCT